MRAINYEAAAAKWNAYAAKHGYTGCPVTVADGARGNYGALGGGLRHRFAVRDSRAAADGARSLRWTRVADALAAGADRMVTLHAEILAEIERRMEPDAHGIGTIPCCEGRGLCLGGLGHEGDCYPQTLE